MKAAWYVDCLPFLCVEIHLEGAFITLVLLSTLALALLTFTRHQDLHKVVRNPFLSCESQNDRYVFLLVSGF